MLGIQDIGIYTPKNTIDNLSRAESFDRPEDFIRDKIGFLTLPRVKTDMMSSDMCVEAFKALSVKEQIDLSTIDCIVVCTQNPDHYGLPHTSAIVHDKLDCGSNVAAFDISLGCSGYVYSLNIIQSFMIANGLERGLLFTADPYSKVLNPADYITELIFGDAATCSLITNQPKYVLGKTLFATNGKKHNAIAVNSQTGLLEMNGQDVFKFTMKVVPKQIKKCLEENRLTAEDVDLVLLHQASKYIVDNMTKKLSFPADKVPFAAQYTGNSISSSIPMMLAKQLNNDYNNILLSGFGVGLSWATSILKRVH